MDELKSKVAALHSQCMCQAKKRIGINDLREPWPQAFGPLSKTCRKASGHGDSRAVRSSKSLI